MITLRQIDAALGLLGMKRSDFARKIGVRTSTFNAYFTGKAKIPSDRLGQIQAWLEGAGLVFTEQGGVNPNVSDIITYEGKQGFEAFMEDVYQTAKQEGGLIYLFNSRPKLWYDWLGKDWYTIHSERMAALGDHITVKIVVEADDDVTILNSAQHKYFPKGLYRNKIFYAYGSKLAFLRFEQDQVTILVINQPEFTDMFRVLYDVVWDTVALELTNHQGENE